MFIKSIKKQLPPACRAILTLILAPLVLSFLAFFPAGKTLADTPGSQNVQNAIATGANIAPVWQPLAQRLAKDGLDETDVAKLLSRLNPVPTQSPMGRKILELYKKRFLSTGEKKTPQPLYYKGVVTQANASLCRQYVNEHQAAFQAAYARYGVSPAIAAALLFVETRLGKVLADVPENAFYTLASMAVSTHPQDISQYLAKMPGYPQHMGWLEETMRKRADWAYNEVRALIQHMLRDGISPDRLPSSIYGAIGLCQFMPSNITPYGADGDGDGRVDLFNPADAIASLARYLAGHGWKKGLDRQNEHRLLMTYNHSQVYANTILALSEMIDNPDLASPVQPRTHKKKRGKKK